MQKKWPDFFLSLWISLGSVILPRLSCPSACGMLVPQPGIKPRSAFQGRCHWTSREVPDFFFPIELNNEYFTKNTQNLNSQGNWLAFHRSVLSLWFTRMNKWMNTGMPGNSTLDSHRKALSRRRSFQGLPWCPVVKTLHFWCRGCQFDPWSGNTNVQK